MALPALSKGRENWTIQSGGRRRITATEMKYMRKTAGYNWRDHKTKIEMELNITPALDKMQD
jgi:hypothetical protein